jgi:hypothetical protein
MRARTLSTIGLCVFLSLLALPGAAKVESLASKVHRALQCASSFGKVENTRNAVQRNQGQRVAFRGTYKITTFGVPAPGNFSGYATLDGRLLEVTWSEASGSGMIVEKCLR